MPRPLRIALFLLAAMGSSACETPTIVDCAPGRFARTDGADAWCVYPAGATLACPDDLPVEHALPWGGRGCAEVEHDPLPDDLCVNAGVCTVDGGP